MAHQPGSRLFLAQRNFWVRGFPSWMYIVPRPVFLDLDGQGAGWTVCFRRSFSVRVSFFNDIHIRQKTAQDLRRVDTETAQPEYRIRIIPVALSHLDCQKHRVACTSAPHATSISVSKTERRCTLALDVFNLAMGVTSMILQVPIRPETEVQHGTCGGTE
jgi:hypothetical protein